MFRLPSERPGRPGRPGLSEQRLGPESRPERESGVLRLTGVQLPDSAWEPPYASSHSEDVIWREAWRPHVMPTAPWEGGKTVWQVMATHGCRETAGCLYRRCYVTGQFVMSWRLRRIVYYVCDHLFNYVWRWLKSYIAGNNHMLYSI